MQITYHNELHNLFKKKKKEFHNSKNNTFGVLFGRATVIMVEKTISKSQVKEQLAELVNSSIRLPR